MTVFTNNQGTTIGSFRIGVSGPTIYTGAADPTVTPPTPLADGLKDGDLYFRTQTGGAAIWVYDGSFTQIASGAGGGSFAGDITMLPGAQFLGDDAAAAGAPAYAFDGDTDTGMFQNNPDEISFATGGIERFIIESDGTLASTTAGYEALVLADNDIPNRKYVHDNFIDTAGDSMTGDLTMAGSTQLFLNDGSVSDPAITFTSDPDTGIIAAGAGDMAFVADGVGIMEIGSEGAFMLGGAQFIAATNGAGSPGYSFDSDLDTGLFSDVAGESAFSSNGTETIRFGASTVTGTLLWNGPDGAVGTPAISFSGDPNTGFFRTGSGAIAFSSDGTNVLGIDGTAASGSLLWQGGDGTAANPALSFSSDDDNGMYLSGPDAISFATSGTPRFTIGATGILTSNTASYETVISADNDIPNKKYVDDTFLDVAGDTITGDISASGVAQFLGLDAGSGSAGTPSFSFVSDEDTGMYQSAVDSIAFSVGGTYRFGVNATRFDVDVPIETVSGSNANPAYSFDGDEDTGMYRSTANTIGFATAGTSRWLIQSDGDFEPSQNNMWDIGAPGALVNTVYATTFDGTATAAQYSDLAERYTTIDKLEPGDVVVICDHEDHDICAAEEEADFRVLGVVSTAPGFMMNKDAGDDETAPYIALRGRVPVKVCGTVRKGDLLITCGEKGCARAVNRDEEMWDIPPHAVFAKALSVDKDGVCEAVIL